MSSPVDFDALLYARRLQGLLLAQPLPNAVNLGEFNMLPDVVPKIVPVLERDKMPSGAFVKQDGFIPMTEEQQQQLVLQLQAHPSVTSLNLHGNKIGPDGMRLLAGPIAMHTGLKTLDLSCTCLLC
jgi:hypothetical protein